MTKWTLLATSALTLSLNSGIASAQETDNTTVDEIIVTATRRAESIQDVPIAVTALSQSALEREGVNDIVALTSLSTSFNINSAQTETGGTTLRIRGVGTTGNNIGLESSVGVFLDGVFLSRPGVALTDLLDVNQIEVLRGPQGTLFGRNTSAGALNVTTKKPNLDELEGFANATYGNFDQVNFQGGVSFPLVTNELGIRLSGAYRSRDGFLQSSTGAESGSRDRYVLRGQLLWEPDDSWQVRAIFDYAETDDECCDAVLLTETPFAPLFDVAGVTPANGGVTDVGLEALDNRRSNADQFFNPSDQFGVSLEIQKDFGAATLTYIGAYREFDAISDQDSDFTAADIFRFGSDTTIENFTHEVRLQGEAFNSRLNWLIGAYYSDEDISEVQSFVLGDDFQPTIDASILGAAGAPAAFPFGTNPFALFTGGVDHTGDFANNLFTQNGKSFSIFTHNILDITEDISLTVGLRYVDESKDGQFTQLSAQSNACFAGLQGAVLPGAPIPVPDALTPLVVGFGCFPFVVVADSPFAQFLPLPQTFNDRFEDDELVYTIKGSYQVSDDVLFFAGFTHGFKSGGFNLDPTAASGGASPIFNSEEIDSYEAGLKATLPNGITANFAFFHQNLSDFQVLEFTGAQFQTFNVPRARSTGVELEVQGNLNEFFSFNLSGTYANARYPENCADGLQGTVSEDLFIRTQNLCGSLLTNSSRFNGLASLTYEAPLSDTMDFFITGSVKYESRRRTATQPTVVGSDVPFAFDFQPGNAKINLRAGIHFNENITFEAWVTNLTDQQTRGLSFNVPLRGFTSPTAGDLGSVGAFLQEPRFYGATIRYKF
ncbi:TonB-dependent receptor [Kordiimonas sp. SCSIO 12610]|uniref:TonB-dependent receptor n=1 Tax=Kordiimonas sp. SCSIO 12610 TaxID=2829597 RepID=UPI00210B0E59|nr:TonB-dependent receptor [Kordiimonas sp. SCSIO 12610]UTW56503.1 TonB-dependent receptor [Kordiimonas sp. SCSIO 12610]